MQFDDRLATVLRTPARSEAGARTQFRQLLDLLGSMSPDVPADAAYARLGELADELPDGLQSQILRAPGLRLRNPALADWLARGGPQAAAAAMATAQLAERDWLALIPRLPVTARGFLRHRRDLPFAVRQMLDRLGVRDLVLPEPEGLPPRPAEPQVAEPAETVAGIGALVRRIEAFQRARREGTAPRLPLEDTPERLAQPAQFDFVTDARGTIVWADARVAPLVVGMALGQRGWLDAASAEALRRRLPLAGQAELTGSDAIAGAWHVDAAPSFDRVSGAYLGHRGRMRRPAPATPPALAEAPGDRMRQVLHELRTPVNAIQGFAEIIQQQLFGPAPHEYRALAGAVAVDAARLMAGFDELDRLAKLETGALALEPGACDLRGVVTQLLRRLEGVLRPRSAQMALSVSGSPFAVGIDESEALRLAWRLLATLAGALGPGEVVDLELTGDGEQVTLRADLPTSLLEDADVFAAGAPAQPRAVSAGMFGSGFALRLARAEAMVAGGTLVRQDDAVILTLPALTASDPLHSVEGQR
jgi:two-component system OmpR family sensor kinase